MFHIDKVLKVIHLILVLEWSIELSLPPTIFYLVWIFCKVGSNGSYAIFFVVGVNTLWSTVNTLQIHLRNSHY